MRLFDRRIIFSALTVVVVLGTAELLVRVLWSTDRAPSRVVGTRRFVSWLSERSLGRDVTTELYTQDAGLLWALRPDVQFESVIHHRLRTGEEQRVRITINEDGYRGRRVGPMKRVAKDRRVLCLGDSNFFGYPLDDADGFPVMLETALGRRTDEGVAVINAGVPGYSVLQGEAWYARKFVGHEFDWLLLSFLNNDAWRQPTADRQLLSRRAPAWVGLMARRIRLVQWARSLLFEPPGRGSLRPRVSLREFDTAYRALIEEARQKNARVMILDFRAYPKYEPYSDRLQRIALDEGAIYFPVAQRVGAAFEDSALSERYADKADRVRRRWTVPGLQHRPHLRYYAEVEPEHLNEVGVAWLADVVAETLLAAEDRSAVRRTPE